MADYRIEAELRPTGKNAARRLRRQGKLPGVIYGGGKPGTPVAFPASKLEKLLLEEHFHATMIEIQLPEGDVRTAVLKEVQYDPLTDRPIHVDFQEVHAEDLVHMVVPIVAVNFEKCPGAQSGGVLEILRHEIDVVCRADAIPEHIEVDCSQMEIGDVVHVEDLALPEGVKAIHEENFAVLTIVPPTVESAGEKEAGEGEEETPSEG